MANYEHGRFTFNQDEYLKTIELNNEYNNQVVIKLTPLNNNISVYLSDVQNNYFTVSKNSDEQLEVNYIVIESES